jgi:hypothetical protein
MNLRVIADPANDKIVFTDGTEISPKQYEQKKHESKTIKSADFVIGLNNYSSNDSGIFFRIEYLKEQEDLRKGAWGVTILDIVGDPASIFGKLEVESQNEAKAGKSTGPARATLVAYQEAVSFILNEWNIEKDEGLRAVRPESIIETVNDQVLNVLFRPNPTIEGAVGVSLQRTDITVQQVLEALAALSPVFGQVPAGFYKGQNEQGMVNLREDERPPAANH